jgi:C4-dicarboxylate transporter DctQ subunit
LLSRILDSAFKGMALLAGLLLLFMTFSISYSIFARFVGIRAPIWTVQFNEYSLLWMTFLASAWVLTRRKHVSIDIITGRLRSRARRIMDMVHSLMGVGVCGVIFWYGTAVTWTHFQRGVTDVQAVDVPKYLLLMVIPFGFLSLTLQFVRNLVAALREIEKEKGAGTQESALGNGSGAESKGELPQGRKD